MSDRQALREAIVVLRLRTGMTQKALAARSGISDSYLNRIERGHTELPTSTLAEIARGLGRELSELVRFSELLLKHRQETEARDRPYPLPEEGRTRSEVHDEEIRLEHFLDL
jgi:transcriptional regulator with XRE-family HTH domain